MAIKKWTDQELDIIRKNAFIPMRELLKMLPGRNMKGVYWKMSVLGINRQTYARYSASEDSYIRSNYQGKGNREIARHLMRTEKSIAKRMIVLGLKRTEEMLNVLRVKSGSFKKGRVNPNRTPLGSLVLAYDSVSGKHYYKIKTEKGFVRFSRYLYEKINGVVLTNEDVIFHKDGDSMNILIENLVRIKRSDLLVNNNMEDDAFIKRIFRVNDPEMIENIKTENRHLLDMKKAQIKLNQKIKQNVTNNCK